MPLTLLLIVQLCTTVLGSKTDDDFKTTVPINGTCNATVLKVRKNFTVLEYCLMTCKGSLNLEDAPDERLCNLAAFGTEENVKYTGKCNYGSCRPPGKTKYPVCFGYETMDIEGEEIAKVCHDSCFSSDHQLSEINLPNGQKCVVPSSYFRSIFKGPKVGICVNGTCKEKKLSEDTCGRKVLTVSSRINIDASCTLECKNDTTKRLKDGTQCVFRSTVKRRWPWFWRWTTQVNEIGICLNGKCARRKPYKPPEHNTTKGCNATDILIHSNLTVASDCRAGCSHGTVENRTDYIHCLWQYIRGTYLDFFSIGSCLSGICQRLENYTVVVER
uniref:Putative secreted protein n=2 Tax=Ixodes ricinus TaxID=34613 RepID=V5H829_IXORI